MNTPATHAAQENCRRIIAIRFDRMLVAQSLEESLPLISRDPLFVS